MRILLIALAFLLSGCDIKNKCPNYDASYIEKGSLVTFIKSDESLRILDNYYNTSYCERRYLVRFPEGSEIWLKDSQIR